MKKYKSGFALTFLFIRFELRTQEATQLKMELDKAQETIQAAETLVSKLDGEFKRWSGQVWSHYYRQF